eukprot:CAMPEP_0197833574 /NCGR_PEP_ID=MMETSP1437-20131217/19456_1 /TAXON_ID=49252 ORGANISM="Eucampia antarctica, Strain CCMP1452" /NCGR_SAMPLE_ID=MMETSP1437 /ASSEMBLY_ACC=CAM_ASM_001096 /LENGTH=292 /DNA_ID=CAMNT_0043437699 /DNA_START=28 /DNA_END=906 /DNA_ORIENTATION=+
MLSRAAIVENAISRRLNGVVGVGGVMVKLPNGSSRQMGTGTRGARGHGWFKKYREGKGGRHLQGRYHYRNVDELLKINDEVFSMNDDDNNIDNNNNSNMVYLDISLDGEESKRVCIELASRALPTTCSNFQKLCQTKTNIVKHDNDDDNDDDDSRIDGDGCDWGYEYTNVFKIEKSVGLCMGDVAGRGGKGGMCHPSVASAHAKIPYTFPHESHAISHAGPGIVSMLSSGLDKNDSRFIITTNDAPQLDGRYVAFGRVKEGLDYLINDIAENVYTRRGKPAVDIQIVSCGSL